MALLVCLGCTTRFAVGAPCCPQCQSTDFEEDGAMPKITRHGGPTNRYDGEPGPELIGLPAGAPVASVAVEPEGSEDVSAGSSSGTSSASTPTSSEPSRSSSPKLAPMTGSRSGKGRTGSRTARSTGGSRAADTSAADDQ